ncbi:MAG: hypothetical protein ACRDOS_00585 [Gaiellaceae bacterium]
MRLYAVASLETGRTGRGLLRAPAMIADVRADESDLADRLTVKTLDLETPAN